MKPAPLLGAFPTLHPPEPKNKARQRALQSGEEYYVPKAVVVPRRSRTEDESFLPLVVSPFEARPKITSPEGRRRNLSRPKPDQPPVELIEPPVVADQRPAKRRPVGKAPNYIGAGRPPSPIPAREAPHAWSQLRRPETCGRRDDSSVALPHALMYRDVGREVANTELDLTG